MEGGGVEGIGGGELNFNFSVVIRSLTRQADPQDS